MFGSTLELLVRVAWTNRVPGDLFPSVFDEMADTFILNALHWYGFDQPA